MAYYLTIKEKNNNYKLLDITPLEEFQRLTKFKNNSYSLEEIDKFTSKFDNEITLKAKLYNSGVITLEEIEKDIEIRTKKNGKLEKVMYGLVYNNMQKYLNDYYLRIKILELQNDINFIKKLLNHYRKTYKQENIAMIRSASLGLDNGEISIYDALSSFFKDEVYSIEGNTGELKIKYKSLHDLGMFVYNYLYKKDKSQNDLDMVKLSRINELITLKETLIAKEIYIKPKVRTRRKEIDGQISFFD